MTEKLVERHIRDKIFGVASKISISIYLPTREVHWNCTALCSQTYRRSILHTSVFHKEIYAIKACIMKNTETGYKCRNIYILADSQAAINILVTGDTGRTLDVSIDTCGGAHKNIWPWNRWSIRQTVLLTSTPMTWACPQHIHRESGGGATVWESWPTFLNQMALPTNVLDWKQTNNLMCGWPRIVIQCG